MSGYIGSTPVPQATQHREAFTATEGQTSFATAGYTPLFLDVYLNGSHLSPADFVATNGSDVVLVVAASADDICDIISYSPFEVANPVFTGSATFNEGSADADFRVETNANANAFIIDGGDNTITADSQLIAGLARSNTAGACAFIVDPNDTTVTYGFRIDAATNSFNIDNANNARNLMSFDITGAVTMPLQPAFQVHKNSTDQNNIAENSDVVVSWSHANFDQNSDFDLGNNRFVAPVAGQYQFNLNMRLENTSDGANYYIISIVTSSGSYQHIFDPDVGQDQVYWPVSFSILATMAATHTAYVTVLQENSGDGGQTDVDGQRAFTNFSGYLVA